MSPQSPFIRIRLLFWNNLNYVCHFIAVLFLKLAAWSCKRWAKLLLDDVNHNRRAKEIAE